MSRPVPPNVVSAIGLLRAHRLTWQQIADALNTAGVPTARGAKAWRASTVASAVQLRGWNEKPETDQ